jgi:uncharacterized membrane protein
MKQQTFRSGWFLSFIIIATLLGIVLYFVNLDLKVYWTDEVFTSLRISGQPALKLPEELANKILTIEDLQFFQRVDPTRDWRSTVASLSTASSNPPLYFVFSKFWAASFGSHIASIRLFSVLISLLCLPLMYWLAIELFQSVTVGIMALVLLATSPLFILYAQEARHYSLWAFFTLLSSAALLHCMRSPQRRYWALYAWALVFGMWTHFFAILVALSQALYVLLHERFRCSSTVKTYLVITAPIVLILTPSLMFGFNFGQAATFTRTALSPLVFLQRWLINLSLPFFDPQIGYQQPLFKVDGQDVVLRLQDPYLWVVLLFAGFVIFALSFLLRYGDRSARLFMITSIGFTFGTLALPDLIAGGQRSTIPRYFIPCYLNLILACAYLLASQLQNRDVIDFASKIKLRIKSCQLAQFLTVFIILTSLTSALISSRQATWWTKYTSYYNPYIAQEVNNASVPVLVSGNLETLLSLSHILEPDTRLLLANLDTASNLNDLDRLKSSDIFLYKVPMNLRDELVKSSYLSLKEFSEADLSWKTVQ